MTNVTNGQVNAPAAVSPAPSAAPKGPVHELGAAAPANSLFGIMASMTKLYETTKDQKEVQGDEGDAAIRSALAKWMNSGDKVTASQMKEQLDNLLKESDKFSAGAKALLEDLDKQVTDYKGPQFMQDQLAQYEGSLRMAEEDKHWYNRFTDPSKFFSQPKKCQALRDAIENQKRQIDQFGGELLLKAAAGKGSEANATLETLHAAQTAVQTTVDQADSMSKAIASSTSN